jgi:hypothetical protein
MTAFERHWLRLLNKARAESGYLKPLTIAAPVNRPRTQPMVEDDADLDANGNVIMEKIKREPIKIL